MVSNCWAEFLKYMSAKEIGDTFTRQDMLIALNAWPEGTVDSNRVLSKNKNFLKPAGRGSYEVIRKFPTYMTFAEFCSLPEDNLGYLEYVLNKKEQRL